MAEKLTKIVADKFEQLNETVRKTLDHAKELRGMVRLAKGNFILAIMDSLIEQNRTKCWFKQIPMSEYIGTGQGTVSKAKTYMVNYSDKELEGSKNHADNWQKARDAAEQARDKGELVKFMDGYTNYNSTPNTGAGSKETQAQAQERVAKAASKDIDTSDVDKAFGEISSHLNAVYAAVHKMESDLTREQCNKLIELVDKVRAKIERAPALQDAPVRAALRPAANG